MELKRPILGLAALLVLIGGGGLTACGDPVNSNSGTPKDTASNTSQHEQTQDNSDPQNDSGTQAPAS